MPEQQHKHHKSPLANVVQSNDTESDAPSSSRESSTHRPAHDIDSSSSSSQSAGAQAGGDGDGSSASADAGTTNRGSSVSSSPQRRPPATPHEGAHFKGSTEIAHWPSHHPSIAEASAKDGGGQGGGAAAQRRPSADGPPDYSNLRQAAKALEMTSASSSNTSSNRRTSPPSREASGAVTPEGTGERTPLVGRRLSTRLLLSE